MECRHRILVLKLPPGFPPGRACRLLDPAHLAALQPDLDPVRMRLARRKKLLDSSGGQPARALVRFRFYLYLQSGPQITPVG